MNRADLKRLAQLRIREAKVLLDKGFYAGAYYLAGYAVECALKARIAKQKRKHDFPPSPEVSKDIYIHDLGKLRKRADLPPIGANTQLELNWGVVKDWSEQKRYDHQITKADAQSLYAAIVDPTDGVLIWLKKSW